MRTFAEGTRLPDCFDRLVVYDLDPRRLPDPALREAVLSCHRNARLLANRFPPLADLLRVDRDPHRPSRRFRKRWRRAVRRLARQLGVHRKHLGYR